MVVRPLPIDKNAIGFEQELQNAFLGTALRLCKACRRFEAHRRRRGFDHRCSLLLDEVKFARSLLLVLADEVIVDANCRRATAYAA